MDTFVCLCVHWLKDFRLTPEWLLISQGFPVSRKTLIYFIFTSKTQNLFAHPPEVVTMAKKFVTTLKGCNNGKIKLLQRLQVVTMAN